MDEGMEWAETMRDLISRLNSYLDERNMEGLLSLYLMEDDPHEKSQIRNDIETILGTHSAHLLFSDKPLLRVPELEESSGDVFLGRVIQGNMEAHLFSLYTSEFTRHIGIYGQTGHGKTSLVYSIIDQLIELKVPFLYLDLKKDGRCLLRQHEDLMVIPWRQLRWNPLRNPPGLDVKSWWQLFAEVCGHAWGVFHAGVNYILEYLDQLYERYDGNGKFPTLVDVFELMTESEEKTRKRQEYFDVMYNRVRSLISVLGEIVDVKEGLKIEEVLKYPVVLELDQLRAEEQNWMAEVMLTWVYAYRLVQGHRSEKLRHCVIIDEAHRIFDVNKEYRETTREMGMPTINLFPTQFRDFGESLIVTSQEPNKVTDSIHANTLVKIVGNLGSGKDINAISEAMNLSQEERECIPKLQRGEWIVKLSDRYTRPFVIKTPYHPADKDVSDEEVMSRARPFLSKFEPRQAVKSLTKTPQLPTISDDGRKLLFNVNAHPFSGLTTRCKSLSFSWRTMETAKAELTQKGLVEEIEIALESSRPAKFLAPTKLGLQFLKEAGQKTVHWDRLAHSSFEHRLYAVLIAYGFKNAGHEAYIEKALHNSKRLDVFAILGERRIGVEIELDTTTDIGNKLEYLNEVDELIILAKDANVLRIIETKLKNFDLRNVHLDLLSRYLKELRSKIVYDKNGGKTVYRNRTDPDSDSWKKTGEKRSLESKPNLNRDSFHDATASKEADNRS